MALHLSPESIPLSTTAYNRWEEFWEAMSNSLAALVEFYQPKFFSRLGLRYVDAVERSRLGLGGRRWSELLRPEILGELSLPQFEDSLEEAQRVIRLKFGDGSGSILLRHGLGHVQGNSEVCYMIDFDFYTDQKTELAHAETILHGYNRRAGRAFRWCITDDLHRALEPTGLDPGSGRTT